MADGTDQTYWGDGLPATWLQTSADTGTQQFWGDGMPADWIDPQTVVAVFQPRHPAVNLTNLGLV